MVRVAENSPAHHAGLEPFFDFCIGIDGVALDPTTDVDGTTNPTVTSTSAGSTSPIQDKNQASQVQTLGMGAWKRLEEREGTQVILNVWNSRSQEMRGEFERENAGRCKDRWVGTKGKQSSYL